MSTQKQYGIVFTCNTTADSPEQALAIALTQIEMGSAWVEVFGGGAIVKEGELVTLQNEKRDQADRGDTV